MSILDQIKKGKTIISNFSYLSIMELFVLIVPLITYPYLVRVLGKDLYGWVITAQITASYASILVDFGFRRVSAKYISLSRDNPRELGLIVSTIFFLRFILWIISFIIYISVILLVPDYRSQFWIFFVSFGWTLNSLLFPDFYFQGTEKMKYITISSLIVRSIILLCIFIFVQEPSDYIYVPVFWSLSFLISGIWSSYIILFNHKLSLVRPKLKDFIFHFKETTPIFLSDILITLKNNFNYNLIAGILGMSDVVIYDLGSKITNILIKPTMILSQVLFPKMSLSPNIEVAKKILKYLFIASIVIVILANIFLNQIVLFFLDSEIDLAPLRLFLLAPIFMGFSYFIPSSIFVAFGKNKYVMYSTYLSTVTYIILLLVMYLNGWLSSLMNFIILTVISYLSEACVRLYFTSLTFRNHNN